MNYTYSMNFEWDEAKSEACFIQRGFDFAYAARAFFDPNRTAPVRGGIHPTPWRHAHHLGTQSQSTRGQAL
jgi:hypothetical protein